MMEQPERFQSVLKPYRRTAFWKVAALMLLLGLIVGVRTCLLMRVSDADEQRLLQRERDRVR